MKRILLSLTAVFSALTVSAQQPLNCLHFDGTNDYVSCPLPSLFTNIGANDFTVEAWINREAGGRVFYAQQDGSNFATLLLSGANILFYVKVSNITYTSSVTIPPAGQWIHVACTWDASAQLPLIYFNGVLQSGTSGGASSFGTNNVMTIGSRSDGQQPFMGMIDEFRIWNTTRTACEILSMLHSEPDGSEANLIDYYNFNRGTAGGSNAAFTTLPDQVGTNSGTLNNFALSGSTSNWIASGAGISVLGAQPAYTTSFSQEICDGSSYLFGSQTLTTSGTYIEPFTSVGGCDSLVTLALTVHPIQTSTQSVSVCESYTWAQNGAMYTASGIYTDTISSVSGCDSILALDLTILQPTASSQTVTACGSYQWLQNGATYTASGIYTDTIANAAGCDSVISLNLTINLPTAGATEIAEACESYTWAQNGQTYIASGIYTDVVPNAAGCDSTLTLDLTIRESDHTTEQIVHCGPYFWEAAGMTVSFPGIYNTTLSNIHGCDSVVTLNILINAVPTAEIAYDGDQTLSSASSDVMVVDWIDCSTGLPVPGFAGSQTFTPPQNGEYAMVVTANMTFCEDTSDCFPVDFVGLVETASLTLSIAPNPATEAVTVTFPGTIGTLIIRDAQGKQVREESITSGGQVALSDLQKGVYLFCLQTDKGKRVERVILQ